MGNRPQHVEPPGGALLRAKAMSAPTRAEIVMMLRAASTPLTAAALASALGIHQTAVRRHLAMLGAAGLVQSQPLPINGRGRPRNGFTVLDAGTPYRELASLLVDAVRSGQTAREAGRVAGARVVPSADGPLATVFEEAERLGFEPEVRSDNAVHEVVLRTCPFADLASMHPDTVCDLHVGLAEGIAQRTGGLAVDGIRLADPRTGGCRIVLRDVAT